MAEQDGGLLAIEVDADDYAEPAAADTPSVSRTYQSEADFQAIKSTYTAKQDCEQGVTYQNLMSVMPALDINDRFATQLSNGDAKICLGKKEFQLLGYAVGEMYFDKEYSRIIELCERVRARCEMDAKLEESLDRWERRCRERMA